MKQPEPMPRASHVNHGTSVPHDELPWPEHAGPVIRLPKLHVEAETRAEVTRFGGLALAEQFCKRFGVAALLDEHVEVLRMHSPYQESDHVLAHRKGQTHLFDDYEYAWSSPTCRVTSALPT